MLSGIKPLAQASAVALLLSLCWPLCTACTETSIFSLGGCKSDDDCDTGYKCNVETGECVEKSADGDIDASDGDVSGDGDYEIDDDIDLEEWLEKCDENPPISEMFIPCKKQECSRVNPPECWSCVWIPDSEQNGDACTASDGAEGQCRDGVCKSGEDGDTETEDGDENGGTCEQHYGRCARPDRDCRQNEEAASDNYDCEGLCCIQKDCVKEGQSGNAFDENDENDICCNGLEQVSNAAPDNDNECVAVPDGSFYCTKCGNDNCGPGENFCRCPEDCSGEIACNEDEDCPAASCADLVGGIGCQEHAYSCDDGQCILEETNIEDSACNENTGLCEQIEPSGCTALDGYCTDIAHSCNDGYYASDDALDCSGGYSARCCLPEIECIDDSDCPDDWCQGFSGLPNCIQYSYSCSSLTCDESQQLYENYLCNDTTGKCIEMNAPECVLDGGYCSTSAQACVDGYYQADSSRGCPGGYSARCCLQENVEECEEDSDCGEIECANTPNGQCMQMMPVCAEGSCQETSEMLSGKICNSDSGLCESGGIQSCEDLNGECRIIILGCGQGYHVNESAPCDGAPLYACCVKD